MATPRSKEKILRCARELFYRVGFQATSVDDIIERTGVAKSNFYYHFKSKEHLAFAVLETQVDEYEAWVGLSLRNPGLSPSERLQSFLRSCARRSRKCRKWRAALSATLPPRSPLRKSCPRRKKKQRERYEQSERFRQHISHLFRHLETALCECLTEGAACGEFRSDIAPAEMASFLLASVEGLLILTKTHKDMTHLTCGLSVAQRLIRVR